MDPGSFNTRWCEWHCERSRNKTLTGNAAAISAKDEALPIEFTDLHLNLKQQLRVTELLLSGCFQTNKTSCYLDGVASAGTSRGFPWPLLRDAVDIIASPCGRVQILLPQLQDLKGLLTRSRAGRLMLRLRLALLLLHLGVKRGVLPGQLGQVRLCRNLMKWMEGQMR